jgi:sodium-dependent phosphate cotransporter
MVETAPAPGPEEARPSARRRVAGALARVAALVLGVLVFIVALELLKRGAAGYGRQAFGGIEVRTPASALGLGWLLAYLFLSGSPVAALAISLFAAQTLSPLQTLMMITGSRLGASLVVLVAGLIYAARGRNSPEGIAVGVLALLTTAVIYLPAMGLATGLVALGAVPAPDLTATAPLSSLLDPVVDPVAAMVSAHLPAWALVVLGVGTLMAAFALIDRALPAIQHGGGLSRRAGRLASSPMGMFLLGAAVTSVTLSVSVSVAALVPLAARGLVRRERTVPYIMGANITTFVDTLVAALIVGGPAAFTIVLIEMVSVAAVSLLVLLLVYGRFERLMLHLQEGIMRDRRATLAFVAVLVCVPLALLAL